MGALMDGGLLQRYYAPLDLSVDHNSLAMVSAHAVINLSVGHASHTKTYLPSLSVEKRATDPPEAHGVAS